MKLLIVTYSTNDILYVFVQKWLLHCFLSKYNFWLDLYLWLDNTGDIILKNLFSKTCDQFI